MIQFKRIASPILPSTYASRLNSIDVEINDLYSAYDGRAELDALLPEIEAALENLDGTHSGLVDESVLVAGSRLVELRSLSAAEYDFKKLVRLCEEVNSACALQCYYATAMLTRSILDHVAPVFGFRTFSEVTNNYAGGGSSFKDAMHYLDNASPKIGDAHLHTVIRKSESLPTAQQVNCGQQLDVLLSDIIRIMQ
ncbi:hypothetical protein JAO29_21555 [Edaphobacter sp. HDX4]|uniref:hypothetical protein n=1 Tax=Edaphobacter sp. HDX4 TaxID=2794064 RepID=UPI002FE533C4